jgi:hypothetical protein
MHSSKQLFELASSIVHFLIRGLSYYFVCCNCCVLCFSWSLVVHDVVSMMCPLLSSILCHVSSKIKCKEIFISHFYY